MDFKTKDMSISSLLSSKCIYTIPRFQREFTWEKSNYSEFLYDIINRIEITEENLNCTPYFLGTMLFIGDIDKPGSEVLVVDGQQRLTAITILFSALSDLFISLEKNELSSSLFDYIMTKNVDGAPIRILKSDSSYPYLSYTIQDRLKQNRLEPRNEEEDKIKECFDFFLKSLNKKKLYKTLTTKHENLEIEKIDYIDLLKAIRDQVLNCTIISISTKDKSEANDIFEILNAKGAKLLPIELVKNKLFKVISTEEPADYAKDTWNAIKHKLYDNDNPVSFNTFYRHFWNSCYSYATEKKLYDSFSTRIREKDYKDFFQEMENEANNYLKITNPSISQYQNKKEYLHLVQSLNHISNEFSIEQIRPLLLSLINAKDRSLISQTVLTNTVDKLEKFHFVYNAILTNRTNKLSNLYSKTAILLRKTNCKEEINNRLKEFFTELSTYYPSYNDFEEEFIKLCYVKKASKTLETEMNMKVKYVLNNLNILNEENNTIYPADGSIEHIIPESYGQFATNIGNLILLEGKLNEIAADSDYASKKSTYEKSKYKEVQDFINKHQSWDGSGIESRSKKMAESIYNIFPGLIG